MFESNTKGWYGSYSLMGKISAESFPMILAKDKILNGPYKTKKIKDYFSTEDDINQIDETPSGENVDIFNLKYRPPPKQQKKKMKLCEPNTKYPIPEEFKYHHHNHKDIHNLTKLLKKQSEQTSSIYDPKKEYVWARTLSGPQWNCLSGRERGGPFDFKNEEIIEKKEENDVNKNSTKYKNKKSDNKKNKTEKNFYVPNKGIDMNQFGKRTTLKTVYDLRLRKFRPFIKKIGQKTLRVKNILKNLEIEAKNKLKKKYLKLNLDNLEEEDLSLNNKKKKNKHKKNFNILTKCPVHTLNFSKIMPREKIYKNSRNEEGIRPFFSPKYTLVEPRSLTMVSYNKKPNGKPVIKRFEGINNNVYFNIDKVLNKVNNHKENKVILFRNLKDIYRNKKLPLHMNNLYNRTSLETITDKGLAMNNFSSSEKTSDFSTFGKQKSYNKLINLNLLRNERRNNFLGLEKIAKTLSNKYSIKNQMEFYLKNLDDDKLQFTGKTFDSITLKSVEPTVCLTEKEKELFSLNFSK